MRFITIIISLLISVILSPTIWAEEESVEELQQDVAKLEIGVAALSGKALGKNIYKMACMSCHGRRGDGNGPGAQGFEPLPRNFTSGTFEWRTTISGELPSDADLERTVRLGAPGTEMVAWGDILSKEERMAVVQYIKTFSSLFADPELQPAEDAFIIVPEDRPFETSPETIVAGKEIYIKQECDKCHGTSGRGDGPSSDTLEDDYKRPIRPFDFTTGLFRAGGGDRDIYRTISTGLSGTPMPGFADEIEEENRWKLVDYIKCFERERGILYYLFGENPSHVFPVEPTYLSDERRAMCKKVLSGS